MAAVLMVTKVQKMLNSNRRAYPFETWHKNRSSLKVVLFVFKIFKMATNIKVKKNKNKLFKIFKWKDFNRNGYLQWVRHATPYGDHFGLVWWLFWTKMAAKIQKSSDLGEIFGFQVDYDVANWYPSFGSHIMILKIISYLVISCYVLTLFFIHTTYLYCSFGGHL